MSGRPPSGEDLIEIGRVGKPHGVRGAFHVDWVVDAAALKAGFELLVGDRSFVVASRGGTDERPLLSLEGITDRDQIAALRGSEIRAARASLSPLAEGEWFAADLVGLRVVGRGGEELGVVERLTNLPSVDMLEVATGGEPLLVPMVRDAIVSIDPAAGAVTVDAEFLDLG